MLESDFVPAPPSLNEEGSKPLPNDVAREMELRFNVDFSDVKIKTDSQAASSLGAAAFTTGDAIHFAPGEYNPHTKQGQELITHELMHVVQQKTNQVAIPPGMGRMTRRGASVEE